MTAPFAAGLCGFRDDGNPSTADRSDQGSIAWGAALFAELGVPPSQPARVKVGDALESAAFDALTAGTKGLRYRRSAPIEDFAQYVHLGVFRSFQRDYRNPGGALEQALDHATRSVPPDRELIGHLRRAMRESGANHALVERMRRAMAQESVLRMDIAFSDTADPGRLLIAVSSKWTLRTDRAQDCVAQGHKLSSLRRGAMPHFAVLTMEPRPVMLKLIAYGSGTVDCVYHVALPELRAAAATLTARGSDDPRSQYSRQRDELELMVDQGRLRPFSALVEEVGRVSV